MAEPKTRPVDTDVAGFLNAIPEEQRRQDCLAIAALMQAATGAAPQLWGSSIVGFDRYHYRYASGHEGDSPVIAFAARKRDLTLYLSLDYGQHQELLARLGKHSIGKSCLYIKRLGDVDLPTLRELIERSVAQTRANAAGPAAGETAGAG